MRFLNLEWGYSSLKDKLRLYNTQFTTTQMNNPGLMVRMLGFHPVGPSSYLFRGF